MSESKINIPNFSYPFKQVNKEEEYYKLFAKIDNGNYLFSKDGFWHGGIHFSDTVLTDVKATQGIRAIADGELVAYRINDKYLQNDDEEKENEGLYSNGFFLLKHYFEYTIGNKLTFFSLYMHTASKNKYDFSTHKVIGTNRFLRKGTSYNEEDKLEELTENTKITLGEEVGSNRYKVLYVDKTERTDNATIHKSNIKPIEDALKLKTITQKTTASNNIQFPKEKIKIKAGEVIGLVGEYNRSKKTNRELLHLEVFTKDDVNTFATKAKEKYEKDTSADKPKPTKIKIQKDIKEYKKEEILVVKQDITHTNLRKAYDKNEVGYDTKKVVNANTKLQIDESILTSDRYLVTKIKEIEVTNQSWTVHKDYIEDSFEIIETTNTQSEDKIFPMKDVKIIKYKDEKYLHTNEDKYFLYSECIEQHPITFEWAKIISESSNDDISIFENIKKYLLPEFVEDELKINPLYKELFKQIDKDTNGQIEAQELEDASQEKAIKQLTSKYIVKHSSEWDKEISFPQKLKEIYEEYKKGIKSYDKIKQHLENEEKRIENLNFFEECKNANPKIDGFPDSDKVYHFNPIGLVGEFGIKKQLITKEMLNSVANGKGRDKELLKYLNEFAEIYEINTKYKIAHFLSQIAHESSFNVTSENLNYSENRMKQIFACKKEGWNSTTNTCLITHRKRMNIWSNPSNYSKNPQNLANYVYSNRLGNGNESSGDGYRYRGRGLIQLTGKSNYQVFTNTHNSKNINDQQDFIQNPDLIISSKKYGTESAFIFWESRNINDKVNGSNVKEITLLVNGGTNGLIDRETKFNDVLKIIEGI